jgi:preprotein translocase subunit SecG
MISVIAGIHLLFCFLLIALVLLQDPKSAGGGGMFGGGGSNSLLGATGAVTFLTRLTRYSAIIFGITCLSLTFLSKGKSGSVLDSAPLSATAPAAPVSAAAPVGVGSAAPVNNGAAPAAPAQSVPANK